MGTNKLPNMTANVTEANEDLWIRFTRTYKALGFSRTKALEQAAILWMEKHQTSDGTAQMPRMENPFL